MTMTKKLLLAVILACLLADPVSAGKTIKNLCHHLITEENVISSPWTACTFNLDSSSPTYPPHLVDSSNKIIQPTLQNGVIIIDMKSNVFKK